jgi:predicted nucleic acid-binding protein
VLASVPVIFEYEAVLTGPEHLETIGLTSGQANEVLVKVSTPVHLRFLWRPRLKDPADEMILETAVNGGADRLVGYEHHLAGSAAAILCGRFEIIRKSNVALRLQESLLEEARRVAESEGVALNPFINVAVAEKLSALRAEEYFRERGERGDLARAKRLLKRAGRGKPPVPTDEVV